MRSIGWLHMIESLYLYLGTGHAQLRRRKLFPLHGAIEPAGEFGWSPDDPASLHFGDGRVTHHRFRLLHVIVSSALSRFLMLNLPPELSWPPGTLHRGGCPDAAAAGAGHSGLGG
jgi:hypothetical protein